MKLNFAIGSWSFHELYEAGKMNLFGYVESTKYRYHLSHVDIWTGMMHSTEDLYIQRVRQTLTEEDLTLACLATDGTSLWDDDESIRTKQEQAARRYLQIAATLGAKVLRIDLGVRTPSLTHEQFDFLVTRYREYAHIAYESGFVVAPQTHQPAAQVPDNLIRLYEAISSPGFGVILDVSRWVEDTQQGDEKCAPYVVHVHFDSSRTRTLPELQEKVRVLHRAGYRGCWALEYRQGESEHLGVARDLADLQQAVFRVTSSRSSSLSSE